MAHHEPPSFDARVATNPAPARRLGDGAFLGPLVRKLQDDPEHRRAADDNGVHPFRDRHGHPEPVPPQVRPRGAPAREGRPPARRQRTVRSDDLLLFRVTRHQAHLRLSRVPHHRRHSRRHRAGRGASFPHAHLVALRRPGSRSPWWASCSSCSGPGRAPGARSPWPGTSSCSAPACPGSSTSSSARTCTSGSPRSPSPPTSRCSAPLFLDPPRAPGDAAVGARHARRGAQPRLPCRVLLGALELPLRLRAVARWGRSR